jgi:trehalose-phosphatase
MQPDLLEKLRALAASPLLLVACDYDGTLAPLVDDRDRAFPDAGAVRALRDLRALPWTTTSIISGRSVGVLRGFLGGDCPALIAGSHGAEWMSAGVALTGDQRALLVRVTEDLAAIASVGGGLSVERKPASAALHYRGVQDDVAQTAIARAMERCGELAGVRVKPGNKVLEFLVVDANKGEAPRAQHAQASAVSSWATTRPMDAFRVLQPGLQVGEAVMANHRVDGPASPKH